MNSKLVIKQKIALIMLIAISLMILNNILFLHWHQLENGKMLIHAHPYNKLAEKSGTEPKHEHSLEEIFFIAVLNAAVFSILIAGIISFTKNLSKDTYTYKFGFVIPTTFSFRPLMARPPPH